MIVAILAPQHRKEESDGLNGLYYSLSPMQSHQMSRSLLRKVCILFLFFLCRLCSVGAVHSDRVARRHIARQPLLGQSKGDISVPSIYTIHMKFICVDGLGLLPSPGPGSTLSSSNQDDSQARVKAEGTKL